MPISIGELLSDIDGIALGTKEGEKSAIFFDEINYIKKIVKSLIIENDKENIVINDKTITINLTGNLSINTLINIKDSLNSKLFRKCILKEFYSILFGEDKIYFKLIENLYDGEIDFKSKPEKMKDTLKLIKSFSVEDSPLFHLVNCLERGQEILGAIINILKEFKVDAYNNPYGRLHIETIKFLKNFNNRVDTLLIKEGHVRKIN